jgi:hypothetical protein
MPYAQQEERSQGEEWQVVGAAHEAPPQTVDRLIRPALELPHHHLWRVFAWFWGHFVAFFAWVAAWELVKAWELVPLQLLGWWKVSVADNSRKQQNRSL